MPTENILEYNEHINVKHYQKSRHHSQSRTEDRTCPLDRVHQWCPKGGWQEFD